MMAEQTTDVVIVGAGVIGCAIAYYASKAGLKVIVLESHKIGGQGSSAAAGLVAPSPQIKEDGPFAELATASLAYLSQLRNELLEDTGIDIEFDQRGTLRVATSDEQANELQLVMPTQLKLGFDLHWLSRDEVLMIEPGLTPNIYGAVYSPKEGQINTAKLLKAYKKGAERFGAVFVQRSVQNVLTEANTVIGVQLARGKVFAQETILAGGAWTPQAEKWLGVQIPIRPQRGQIVTIGQVKPELHHIIFSDDIYLAPKCDQTITIGPANDYPGYVQTPTVDGVTSLLAQGQEAVSAIVEADFINIKAGLRPKTPDKLPMIGSIPPWKGIQIAAGHNSNGLLFSAITGRSITARMQGQFVSIDIAPYHIERFTKDKLTAVTLS